MKKLLASTLILCLCLVGVGGFAVSALGSGVAVVASEVSVIKSGLIGQKLRLSDTDFKSAFAIADFESITVTKLPSSTEGTLLLAGRRVKEGQTVKRKNIAALVFVPLSAEVTEASFLFTLAGGSSSAETKFTMKFLDKINYAPEAPKDNEASLSVVTQEDISVYGRMSATDPEGDSLEYMIVRYPTGGALKIGEDGSYKYTPVSGFTGYDSFVYVARDVYGNYSDTVTVALKTVERMCDEVFLDMEDRQEYNAAVAMAAMGIMSGSTVGDDRLFMPEEKVTRAEFVAMAMKTMGIRPDSAAAVTFFDDNEKIPASLVGYVATAQRMGIIDGEFTSEGLVFRPNDAINVYSAAVILSKVKGIETDSDETVYTENDTVPIWAMADVGAMFTLGIFDGDLESLDGEAEITRAACAEYLYRLIKA